MPLRIGEMIVGAFTVVSTREAAFTPTDISFIKLIGAVLDVLVAAEHDAGRWEELVEGGSTAEEDEENQDEDVGDEGE